MVRGVIQDGSSGFSMQDEVAGLRSTNSGVVWLGFTNYASGLQTSDTFLEEEDMLQVIQGNEKERASYQEYWNSAPCQLHEEVTLLWWGNFVSERPALPLRCQNREQCFGLRLNREILLSRED